MEVMGYYNEWKDNILPNVVKNTPFDEKDTHGIDRTRAHLGRSLLSFAKADTILCTVYLSKYSSYISLLTDVCHALRLYLSGSCSQKIKNNFNWGGLVSNRLQVT